MKGHHPDKFCGNRYYDSGDIMFLICHGTLHYHMFKELCEIKGEVPHSLGMFGGHMHFGSGDITLQICHVVSQNHVN